MSSDTDELVAAYFEYMRTSAADLIEIEAMTNQTLREALAGVWLRGPLRPDPDPTADRVDRIVAGSP